MSILYLQKGGIDHYKNREFVPDNGSYNSMLVNYRKYALSNAFFYPNDRVSIKKTLYPNSTLTFRVERFDSLQLTVPATAIVVQVNQYNSENTVINRVEYILYNGEKLYYTKEPYVKGASIAEILVVNVSRAYHHNTNGLTNIYIGGFY